MVLGVPGSKPVKDFLNVEAWYDRLIAGDSFKKAMETKDELIDDQGLILNGMPKGINNMAVYEAKMKLGREIPKLKVLSRHNLCRILCFAALNNPCTSRPMVRSFIPFRSDLDQ